MKLPPQRASLWAYAVIFLCVGAPISGWSQTQPDAPTAEAEPAKSAAQVDYEQLLAKGNVFYNKEDYPNAAVYYTQAIQRFPQGAVAYRNMARAYFWRNDYAAAILYYDNYLQVRPGAPDDEQIRKERKLAASRASGEGYELPAAQQMASKALGQQLDSGKAYTKGGGGAWGLYNTLLRTGYAQPDLRLMQRRLLSKLISEFEAQLTPPTGQPTPTLSYEDWELQGERLEAAAKLAETPEEEAKVSARGKVVVGARALLAGEENAAAMLSTAIDANPDLGFLAWLEIAALLKADELERALLRANALVSEIKQRQPALLAYAKVVQAIVLQRSKRQQEAAAAYQEILAR